MSGVADIIANFVSRTTLDDVPFGVRQCAATSIVDTIGVALAGNRSEAAAPLARYMAENPADGDCPVIGWSRRTSAEQAAFANGIHAHALDFDDNLTAMPGHPSAVVLPALLSAMGKRPISGRELIEAYVLGVESGTAIGVAIGMNHFLKGFHATATIGIFAATAGLCKLLETNAEVTARALALAASQASGLQRNFGTLAKPMHAGWAARSAVSAVALAKAGFTSCHEVFEGASGFFALYGNKTSDASLVAKRLGSHYALLDPGIGLKKYPCCNVLHRPLDAMLSLKKEHKLTAINVRNITCRVAPGSTTPLHKVRPTNSAEAQFSLEYGLAAALLDGKILLQTFSDEVISRPAIDTLFSLINVIEDAGCIVDQDTATQRTFGTRGCVIVECETTLGLVSRRIDRMPGSREQPLSADEIQEKFLDCANWAGSDRKSTNMASKLLASLDSLRDIAEPLALLELPTPNH